MRSWTVARQSGVKFSEVSSSRWPNLPVADVIPPLLAVETVSRENQSWRRRWRRATDFPREQIR